MGLFVVNIDENSSRGKAFKTLLQNESSVTFFTLKEYEAMVALKKRIGKSEADIKAGRIYTQEQVKARFKSKAM